MTKENCTHLHVAVDGLITYTRVLVKFIIGILVRSEHRMQETNIRDFVAVVT